MTRATTRHRCTKALEIHDYKGFGKRKRESERHGKLRGIGFATYIEACGVAPSSLVGQLGAGVGLWESAEVRVNPTGSVELLTGCHQHGQGHETTFAQLVSERLGIPIDNVNVVHGDTDKVQFGMGTYGSRSGAVGMSAIVKALDKVETKAKKIAAHLLEAAEGDIVFKDGKFSVAGTDKSVGVRRSRAAGLCRAQVPDQRDRAGPEGRRVLRSDQLHVPGRLPHLRTRNRSGDRRRPRVAAWTAVDDFGTIINPMIVEGQVHGGVAQGVGQALLEHTVYDDKGQLMTGSYMDYAMPRADNLPSFKVGTTMHQVSVEPARHQGLRRGRRDRCAGGGDERHHQCARHREDRHAGNAVRDLGDACSTRPTPAGKAGGVRQSHRDTKTKEVWRFTCTHSPITARAACVRPAICSASSTIAKLLAGGQTLLPTMKQRLASPANIIDLGAVEGMSGIELKGRSLVIGAMTKHADVATSPIVQENLPALAYLAGLIGDPAVRHRGTIGGSIANNDPNADYPAAALGLGATIVTIEAQDRRRRLLQGPVRNRA